MSHGGGGGGGGFGGHGGGYGGHGGGYGGHSPGMHQSQGVVGAHHGLSLNHALGLAQHHGGNMVGGVLHALGLGHHGAQHHVGNSTHEPDQSPTWNQAMQGQRVMGDYLRVDRRPFVVLLLLISVSFGWLWVVYNIHHADTLKGREGALDLHGQLQAGGMPGAAAEYLPPGNPGPYTAQAYGQMQSAAAQNYAAQYVQSGTTNGAQSAYSQARSPSTGGYGYATASMPTTTASSWPTASTSAQSGYGSFGSPSAATQPAYGGLGAGQSAYGQQPNALVTGAFRLGGTPVYAPTANGRARLMVNR